MSDAPVLKKAERQRDGETERERARETHKKSHRSRSCFTLADGGSPLMQSRAQWRNFRQVFLCVVEMWE